MQIVKRLIIILISTLALSCTPEYHKITHEHGQKDVTITIKAERYSKKEPYDITLRAEAFDKFNEVAGFQFDNDSLDNEEVSFDWKKDHQCVITMTESDGNDITFKLTVTKERMSLKRISEST